MSWYWLAALKLFVFLLQLELVFPQLPPDQISTMYRVYDIFRNSTVPFVWNNTRMQTSPCSWKGVSCSPDNSSILGLHFSSFSISSSEFMPLLCQIDSLESLDVSRNYLSSIPDEFYSGCVGIRGLRLLNFSTNRLSGPLPTFNGFRMLEQLDFSRNSLAGVIDLQLGGLDSLRSLNLSHNNFTGNVPINIARMNLLEHLQLSFNGFTGGIPVEITNYRNLSLIDLSLNGLSGSIPEDLGQLTRLEVLVLSCNRLRGEIPTSVWSVRTLVRFAANQNSINGSIPFGVTANLRSLDLSYNSLTGIIPSDLLSRPNLQSVDLSYNDLEGSIPESISTSLFRLRLGSNSLVGILPPSSWGNLVNLTYLELDNNNFTGAIPSGLSLCRNLALLNLAHNRLTGPLPPALGDLTNLQVLNLQFNNIVGQIPEQITELNTLGTLNLSRNSLSGSIPRSISRMRRLANLDLQDNHLNGSIPNSIESLSSLIELQLGKNQLVGPIPRMPPMLQIALNLSNNLFDGPIPRTLSTLTALEVLDLSNNRFSGFVPDFLAGMTSLTHLLLSNNQLYGVLPRFTNFVTVDVNGNNVVHPTETPPTAPQNRRQSLASVIILAFASAAMAVGILIMIVLFISRRYHRINNEHLQSGEKISAPQVIHGHLLTPQSFHRSSIDFKKAMETIADPSNTTLKTRFSTYYKAVMPSGTSYFVKKLNWRIVQLGNHERFREELEVLGKLSNSNIMIPLAYVLTADSALLFYDFCSKGTLFEVLHGIPGSTLDWANRYSIALGVAQGLAFLHGCNHGPIHLLDLSSRTILLKSLTEPQVGDIELCKVVDPSKGTGSLSTVAGSVGYIPPEYAYTMRVTAAGNVYSFGVVLLELLTGKPAVSGGTELAKWVLSNSAQQNKWEKLLDSSVNKTSVAVRNQMLAILKVALACVRISPDARPKMRSVLRMLLNA